MNPAIKNHKGIFLPAHETHLTAWMDQNGLRPDGVPNYQLKKIKAVFARVPDDRRRVAVDVGAHCGLWSYHLAKAFGFVYAFEPVALHRECFRLNLPTAHNVELIECALGAEEKTVSMHTTNTSSGDSWVKGEGDIPMKTLDSFALENVDLIKLDCEGYELFALKGGEETIRRCLPIIIVEQKPHRAEKYDLHERAAVPWLQSIGYTLAQEMSGDFIMTPPAAAIAKPEPVATSETIAAAGIVHPENFVKGGSSETLPIASDAEGDLPASNGVENNDLPLS